MIRPNKALEKSLFGLELGHFTFEIKEEKEIRGEEKKKEKNEKFRYENYLCKETIVRMLVWNCLETLVLEILV